jgi:uncharacterized membrane protein
MRKSWKGKSDKVFHLVSLGVIILYSITSLVVVLNRYWQYQNFYFDFGIFDSAIWKVSRFQIPLVDHVDYGDSNIVIFGNHFNPSIFLFSPLFWLTNKSEILLIAQTICVSMAAYVAYLIAKNTIKNRLAVLSLLAAFLGYVGLQNALISDFHDTTVAVLSIMLLFWAFLKRKWKLHFVFLLITLGLKETFAGFGIALSIFILIKARKYWKISLWTFLISLVWGVVAIGLVIPHFSGGVYFFTPKDIPSSFPELFLRFIYPSLKLKTILYSYMTFGFLPVFDLSTLPLVFENFFERFVLSDGRGVDLGMHYNATLSPFLFMGAMFTLAYMEKQKYFKRFVTPAAVLIIVLVLILHRFILRGPLGLVYNRDFYKQRIGVAYVDNFITQIPKGGIIMTQNDLATRFTHNEVKLLRKNYKLISPDTIVLNLTPGQNPNSFFPLSENETRQLKDTLLKDKDYSLKKFADELYLFRKVSGK